MTTRAGKRGFTAIELLAVMAILTLLGTLAGVAVVGAVADASLDEVAARVVAYDAGARVYAARYGRRLELVLEEGLISQAVVDDEADLPARGSLQLPRRCEVRFIDGSGETTAINISADGRSRSYAVHLKDLEGRERWVVIAGLTGDARVLLREDDAMALIGVEHAGPLEWAEGSLRGTR